MFSIKLNAPVLLRNAVPVIPRHCMLMKRSLTIFYPFRLSMELKMAKVRLSR